MRLNNTKENIEIKKHTKAKRIAVTTGIIITSLFIIFSKREKETSVEINDISNDKEVTTIDDEFNRYSGIYLEELKKINTEDFDSNFINIYENGTVTYNNKTYPLKDLFLKSMDDGSNYLTLAGEKTDFLTGVSIADKTKTSSIKFKNSSCFLKMYEDGIITDTNINLDKDTTNGYVSSWDGKGHTATPDLKARFEADKIYNEGEEKVK